MEGSTVASSQVFPTDKTASGVYVVVRVIERRKNFIANRPRLAEISTAYGTEAASRSVRYKNFTVLGVKNYEHIDQ